MEKRGVPSVAVVTEEFTNLAQAIAKARGYPDLPMIIVPHPFETLPEQEVVELAKAKLNEVVGKLSLPVEIPVKS